MSRQGLLNNPKKRTCGEMMGGATAECAAVVCCGPLAVMDMLVMALYKAPKCMCRKAIEKKRRNRRKKGLLRGASDGVVLEDGGMGNVMLDGELVRVRDLEEVDVDVDLDLDLDLEMYDKFYGTGFWRSDSQRSG